MSVKKKQKNAEPQIDAEASANKTAQVEEVTAKDEKLAEEKTTEETIAEEETSENVPKEELTKEDILEIKEERIKRDNPFEIPEEPEKEDTKFRKILKSLGYFWDYYKWFVIIPAVIILIVVVFIDNYKRANRPFALRLVLINEQNVVETLNAIDDEYPDYRGFDRENEPIHIDYEIEYPKDRLIATNLTQQQAHNMQKLNAMVISGKADVVVSNTWLLDDYSVNKSMMELEDVFDEEFLEENSERIYWYISDEGERMAVGLYVGDCEILNEFENDAPAVAAIFATAEHPEESAEFIKWLLSKCNGDCSDWMYK